MSDTKYCIGCRDDFYNGKNGLGVKECTSSFTGEMRMSDKRAEAPREQVRNPTKHEVACVLAVEAIAKRLGLHIVNEASKFRPDAASYVKPSELPQLVAAQPVAAEAPRERLAEHARDIAETLVEAEDWSGTARGDAAWKRIASLLAQPLAPRSEPSLVERAIEIAQEKVGFRSDVSMHDYGGHSVPDGVHRADCRWCAIVRDARGAVDS